MPNPCWKIVAAVSLFLFVPRAAATAGEPRISRSFSIPLIDLSKDTERQVVVAAGTETVYQGHPTTVLLPDGKTMFAVWTYNHGGPCGPMKRSDDGGLTWSELLPVPDSWREVRNCPAIYRLVDPQGKARLFVFAKLGDGLVSAYSGDVGKTWTDMKRIEGLNMTKSVMPWCTIVPVEGGKKLIAATNARRANDPDRLSNNVVQSVSTDGGLTWGPVRVICDMPGLKPCEPCFLRSPDGKQLLGYVQVVDLRLSSDDEISEVRPLIQLSRGDSFIDALLRLQRDKQELAAVIDANGRTVGLLHAKELAHRLFREER